LNVIVPVGLAPPAKVAVSEIEPPTATGADACELIVGVAWGGLFGVQPVEESVSAK